MKFLYHGTTEEGMNEIIHGNYDPERIIWSCSSPGYMYCYEENALCESECMDEDEPDSVRKGFCTQRANESAQVANAILPKPHDKTYVIQFILDDDVYDELIEEGYLEPDCSCENMEDYGSMAFDSCTLNQLIKDHKIKMRVFVFSFCVKMSLMYLAGIASNSYFEETLEKLPSVEYDALQIMQKTEWWRLTEELLDATFIDYYMV